MLKRRIVSLILLVLLVFTGCSSSKSNLNLDINELAQKLVDGIDFEDTLEKVDDEIIGMFYDLPEDAKGVLYLGSGATAEEVAVFELDKEEDSEEMIEIVKKHIQNQVVQFEDYIPNEVNKLENIILEQYDNYIIVCVTDDIENAKALIKENIK